MTPRVRFASVSKSFEATQALRDVSFDVQPGEVHALLGANGAGKPTLIKILSGLYSSDEGTILLDGERTRTGISFIHQDLGLVDTMTVAESVAMTRGFPLRGLLIDWPTVRRTARDSLVVLGASIPVDTAIGDLSRADRSIVAIARAVTGECRLLVLDEPTASLPDADVQRLFAVVRGLRARGVSVLYVTHRLDEVFTIADRLTVLRDGRVAASSDVADVTHEQLVRLIVGGEPPARVATSSQGVRQEVLRLSNIALAADRRPVPELRVHYGEILGLVGLRGAGQELLGRGLAGVERMDFASLESNGVSFTHRQAQNYLKEHVGFASSRREQEGLAMTLTVRENLFLNPGAAGRRTMSWISRTSERTQAKKVGASVGLPPNRSEATVATFSGGNQQKVVLGRWLSTKVRVLVLEEPTMGIDVGARAEIYELIRQAVTRDGLSVVIVSSDYEELTLLCHRVLVLDRGAVARELTGGHITVDSITQFSSGGRAGKEAGDAG